MTKELNRLDIEKIEQTLLLLKKAFEDGFLIAAPDQCKDFNGMVRLVTLVNKLNESITKVGGF